MQIQLSVVIITFNEEKNIERCLTSIKAIADEIVVVDSFSTDKTKEICSKHNVLFVQRKWEGYSKTKNFANSQAKNNWILSLDADEALSPKLSDAILLLKQNLAFSFCSFNRLTNYCGTWIKHGGWYPDSKIRIFDKTIASWVGEIHEGLSFSTPVNIKHLQGDCLHYSYYSVEQHYTQVEKYTDIAANDLFIKNKSVSFIKLYFSPVVKFFRDYFLKLGFLDGYSGFKIAKISAYATYLKYYKLKQLTSKSEQ